METARIFENGRSHSEIARKKYRFDGDEVFVQRLGDAVLLTPKADAWQTFMSGLNSFTEDFMTDGREPEIPTVRDSL